MNVNQLINLLEQVDGDLPVLIKTVPSVQIVEIEGVDINSYEDGTSIVVVVGNFNIWNQQIKRMYKELEQ